MADSIQCDLDEGKGRAFVVLKEGREYSDLSDALLKAGSQKGRLLSFQTEPVNSSTWESMSTEFAEKCDELKIRQGLFVGLGDAATLLMHLSLEDPRRVRQLVLIDAPTSPHPSSFERMLGEVESYLPMGLPFKSSRVGFDARSYLQRIRCPVLILTTEKAKRVQVEEAHVLADSLPTAWYLTVDTKNSQEVIKTIEEFQEVPAKVPQKKKAR